MNIEEQILVSLQVSREETKNLLGLECKAVTFVRA